MINGLAQTHWKTKVALYFFFEGGGAGCYFIALLADLLPGLLSPFAQVGLIVGLVSVVAGAFFLWLDLGKKWRVVWATRNLLTSWIARGIVLVTLFLILGISYVLSSLWLGQEYAPRVILGGASGLFALIILIYPSMLLKSCKPFKLWGNPMTGVFSGIISLLTGMAMLLIVAFAIALRMGISESIWNSTHFGLAILTGLLYGQIGAAGIYLLSGYASRNVHSASLIHAHGNLHPYLMMVFGVSWVLPLILAPVALFTNSAVITVWFSLIIAVLLLSGSFLTRYLLLAVAIRDVPFLPDLL